MAVERALYFLCTDFRCVHKKHPAASGWGKAKGQSPLQGELWGLRPYERSRCGEHGEIVRMRWLACARPPGVVMVAPSEVPRNALREQSEGRAMVWRPKSAAKGSIKAGARKPRPGRLLRCGYSPLLRRSRTCTRWRSSRSRTIGRGSGSSASSRSVKMRCISCCRSASVSTAG